MQRSPCCGLCNPCTQKLETQLDKLRDLPLDQHPVLLVRLVQPGHSRQSRRYHYAYIKNGYPKF